MRANKGVEPKSSLAHTVAKMHPQRLERSPRLSEVTPLAVLSAPSIEIDPTNAGSRQGFRPPGIAVLRTIWLWSWGSTAIPPKTEEFLFTKRCWALSNRKA